MATYSEIEEKLKPYDLHLLHCGAAIHNQVSCTCLQQLCWIFKTIQKPEGHRGNSQYMYTREPLQDGDIVASIYDTHKEDGEYTNTVILQARVEDGRVNIYAGDKPLLLKDLEWFVQQLEAAKTELEAPQNYSVTGWFPAEEGYHLIRIGLANNEPETSHIHTSDGNPYLSNQPKLKCSDCGERRGPHLAH